VTLLLPTTEVCVYRREDLNVARGGLIDPWDEPDDDPAVLQEMSAVAIDAPMCLQGPYITGSREGGTRQQIEWEARAEPDIDIAPGDLVVERGTTRRWHVLYAISRIGPAGTVLDHVAVRLLSVRGETDTAI
jgi:hypothetical protein